MRIIDIIKLLFTPMKSAYDFEKKLGMLSKSIDDFMEVKTMKKGDKVYVNWPTGKGGPYEFQGKGPTYAGVSVVRVDGIDSFVNTEWIEPVKPELEEGRLYYYWDNKSNNPKDIALLGENINGQWDNIEPVHRRWDELSQEERFAFLNVVKKWETSSVYFFDDIFKHAYKLITGEEHP